MNKNKFTSRLNLIILIILSFIVIVFALKDNFNEIINEILTINLWWFFVGLILMFGYCLFRAMVLHNLILKFDPQYKLSRAFGVNLLAQFFNGITPFGSGQPFVIYTLKREGIRGTDSMNIVIQDFILHQIALIILGTIAILLNWMLNIFPKVIFLKEIVLIGYIVNVAVVVLLFGMAFSKKMNQKITNITIRFLSKFKIIKNQDHIIDKWEDRINRFHDGTAILLEDKEEFIKNVILNILSLLSAYIIPVAILYSLGDYHSFNAVIAIIASAYIMLVGSVIPTPGSTGALEYAFIAFFANFIGGGLLSATMLLWRFLTYYLFLIIGAITFNIWKKRA